MKRIVFKYSHEFLSNNIVFLTKIEQNNNMQHILGLGVGLGINYSLHTKKKKRFLSSLLHASYEL